MIFFAQNIKHLRELKKLTQRQLADSLSVKSSRIGSYEEGRAEPPFELLSQMSRYFGLSIDALVNVDLTQSDATNFMHIGHNRVLFPIVVDQHDNDVIELVPAKASAGYLNGFADPEYIMELPRMELPFIPTGKHRAFPIKGDSMPPVQDGSFVVGKYLEEMEYIQDGRTYILVTTDEGIVYKRVYNKIKEDGTLHLHSDNTYYQPYQVSATDVLEVWEFTCHINTQEYSKEELNYDSIMSMFKELKVELKSIQENTQKH